MSGMPPAHGRSSPALGEGMPLPVRKVAFAAFLVVLVASGPALAQSSGATISGTVASSSQAALANATVSARNVTTGQVTDARTDASGRYSLAGLAPGDYEISISAEGFDAHTERVTLAAGAIQTLNVSLTATPVGLSLGDLGFSAAQTQGSAAAQKRLDRRTHMLKIHQTLGMITAVPMVASLITAGGAKSHRGRPGSVSGRRLHATLGGVTAGLYATTAMFAILAPKIPGTETRGQIRLHKTLAWIHGTGMILTPILGVMAYRQESRGERVHGIASAHGAVAAITAGAFGLAILSVTVKF
jgi:Carboxypeptidase regulatory-like domain